MPFGLVCYRYSKRRKEISQSIANDSKLSSFRRSIIAFTRSPLALSTVGLGVSAVLARHALAHPASTYICPSYSYLNHLAPGVEILKLALICFLLHTTSDLVEDPECSHPNSGSRPFAEGVGYVFLVSQETSNLLKSPDLIVSRLLLQCYC